MEIICPHCSQKNAFEPVDVGIYGKEHQCKGCEGIYIIKREDKRPSSIKFKVMIAHADSGLVSRVESLLRESGFKAIPAMDGVKALQLLEIEQPDAAVIDVALPKYYGFEICNFIKGVEGLNHIKVILLASIYDRTRYKRAPATLHGADDYIEMHHLWDMLVPKLSKLLGDNLHLGEEAQEGNFVVHPLKDPSKGVRELGPGGISLLKETPRAASGKKEENLAKKLARIVACDIILYNEESIEKGIRGGNLYELLKSELREGENYLSQRTGLKLEEARNYILESFDKFVEKKKKEMEIGIED